MKYILSHTGHKLGLRYKRSDRQPRVEEKESWNGRLTDCKTFTNAKFFWICDRIYGSLKETRSCSSPLCLFSFVSMEKQRRTVWGGKHKDIGVTSRWGKTKRNGSQLVWRAIQKIWIVDEGHISSWITNSYLIVLYCPVRASKFMCQCFHTPLFFPFGTFFRLNVSSKTVPLSAVAIFVLLHYSQPDVGTHMIQGSA